MSDQLPLSLYIHVPWCVRKCPYCDFNSHEARHIPENAYLEVLKQDFLLDSVLAGDRPLQSIFIGGGTPSLMSGKFYQHLLEFIRREIAWADDIEITLEANPGTAEAERFCTYHEAGINRISMGVQSFNDQQLLELGRIHSAAEAIQAFDMARAAGFSNINLDLMHGLPNQSEDLAIHDLNQAIALKPEHLSWYQLTIEPNTAFYSSPPILPQEEVLWGIQERGQALLAAEGYQQYEVSAYARDGKRARHNLNYWHFGDYIGIGAGAHSKMTMGDSKHILRYRKTRRPEDYLRPRPHFRVDETAIEPGQLPFEFMMNVLRLNEGCAEHVFEQRTGLGINTLEPTLSELRNEGLLMPNRLQATPRGHLFLNSVLERFL